MRVPCSQIILCLSVVAGNLFLVSVTALANAPQTVPATYSVADFGAKGDDKTKDTSAIQEAIDTCSKNGGRTVYFSPGTYVTGSLHLESRVAL